ncbi:hypothetical protein DAMA08_039640 [Martiniozyma asiatica (nom. inval.)]|nr:hypothetical protein DAMA08_039640 [Martiniozyma asiatica]
MEQEIDLSDPNLFSQQLLEHNSLDLDPTNIEKYPTSKCNRCRKTFAQLETKQFKMCSHCRFLQRERSRRWQKKTREKDGVCTRCGTVLDGFNSKFVLCPHCRDVLRREKSSRLRQGKCVHCSGPNLDGGNFKVCRRCRERDRNRRVQLEHEGACNRCAVKLSNEDKGHKVCSTCRTKKKKNDIELLNMDISRNVRNVPVEELFTDNKEFDLLYDVEKKKPNESILKYLKLARMSSKEDQLSDMNLTALPSPTSKHQKHEFKRPHSASPVLSLSKKDDLSSSDLLLSETTLLNLKRYEDADHSQLNQQLKQLTQFPTDDRDVLVDIDNLMQYDEDRDPDESEMDAVAAVAAATLDMSDLR